MALPRSAWSVRRHLAHIMLPDLHSLSLFVKAARYGSLSEAARLSHTSLSAASRRIAQLEADYGVSLFERTPQGVRLTAAGVTLLHHANQLMHQAATLRADLHDYTQGAVGLVRLGANISAISQALPDQLNAFTTAHPAIKLAIHEARSRAIVHAVSEASTDVGIVTGPTTAPGLDFAPYRTDPLCAIVPSPWAIAGSAVHFEQLLSYDLVGLDDTAAITARLYQVAEHTGLPLRLRVQVQSFEAVCRLVAAGLGVAVLPAGALAPFLRSMPIRRIDLLDAWTQRMMHVCIRSEASGPVRTLFDYLRTG